MLPYMASLHDLAPFSIGRAPDFLCVLFQQATSLSHFPPLPLTVAQVVAVMSVRTRVKFGRSNSNRWFQEKYSRLPALAKGVSIGWRVSNTSATSLKWYLLGCMA